jgi:hypothetical protein
LGTQILSALGGPARAPFRPARKTRKSRGRHVTRMKKPLTYVP